MPLFNYSILFIKEYNDDIKTFIIYNNKTFTIFGTRKRLVDNSATPPIINESDSYCDFYMTFHESNYDGLLTFLSLAFDKYQKPVELGLYSVDLYPEQINTMNIQDMYSYITTENEIFAYDQFKIKKNTVVDNLLKMIIYDEV